MARLLNAHHVKEICIPDLPNSCVQLDVEAFREGHGNAGVAVSDGQMTSGESKSVILKSRITSVVCCCKLNNTRDCDDY